MGEVIDAKIIFLNKKLETVKKREFDIRDRIDLSVSELTKIHTAMNFFSNEMLNLLLAAKIYSEKNKKAYDDVMEKIRIIETEGLEEYYKKYPEKP